jgi:AraC-like DNA-binding protein
VPPRRLRNDFKFWKKRSKLDCGGYQNTRRFRWPLTSLDRTGVGDSVRAVAKRVGLSQRRFIQVFTAQVGLTPKLFCRVLRFQHVREVVVQASTLNWAQLALSCGYYDQSHLIHDFQEFSGLRPTDYLCQGINKLFPNVVSDP